jgi:hypothetical protein
VPITASKESSALSCPSGQDFSFTANTEGSGLDLSKGASKNLYPVT